MLRIYCQRIAVSKHFQSSNVLFVLLYYVIVLLDHPVGFLVVGVYYRQIYNESSVKTLFLLKCETV